MDIREERHDWLVNKIYNNPSLLDIDNIESKTREYALMSSCDLYVVPDIYFWTKYNDKCLEVKGAHNPKLFDKGMNQLEKILYWHEEFNKETPIVGLIMPEYNRRWKEMLRQLHYYSFGDSYGYPTKTYYSQNPKKIKECSKNLSSDQKVYK